MKQLLSVKEVAQRLGTSTKTVSRYQRAGRLVAIRLTSRTIRFEEGEVERFIANASVAMPIPR